MPFVLAAPSRDKKTIPTSLKETLWVPTPWDKGLKAPPQPVPLVCLQQPLRPRPSLRLLLPLGPTPPCSHLGTLSSLLPGGILHCWLATLPSPLYCMPPPAICSLERSLWNSSLSLPQVGTAPLLRWSRFLEGQGEVGTPRLHSLKDGETQQDNHVLLPTPEPSPFTKPQWLWQNKGGKEPASGGTPRRGRWERACLSKQGKAGAMSASGTAHTLHV